MWMFQIRKHPLQLMNILIPANRYQSLPAAVWLRAKKAKRNESKVTIFIMKKMQIEDKSVSANIKKFRRKERKLSI